MSSGYEYVGSELELFAHAKNWKRYMLSELRDYLRGDVLEVGAGIGGTTQALCTGEQASWTCLEPDAALLKSLQDSLDGATYKKPPRMPVVGGTVADLPPDVRYDAILYIDVLEHIEDDAAELRGCVERLRPGGNLVVLAPAHQRLFSEFDAAIGHFRRYNRAMMRALTPPGLKLVRLRYLDSVGLLASAGNRLLLRSKMPTIGQIRFWDRAMVPCSRLLDVLTTHRIGKSILGVWQR